MKLYCLSGHPNKPCNVIQFKGVNIMLDCGLDMSPILHYLPLPLVPNTRLNNLSSWMPKDISDSQLEGELKECSSRIFIDSPPEFGLPQAGIVDFSEVDVILVSNYTCMLALPFITENSGFKGVVYATEPTLQIGRLFLEELIDYIERSPKPRVAARWKDLLWLLPSSLNDIQKPTHWKQICNMKTVNSSLSKIKMIGFNEMIDIFGALKVLPVSSGYCLGSSNWLIMSEYEKIAYVSGSSTLTTHPRPMDQSALRNADILILSGLTQTPTANPDSMLGEFCMTVAVTVRNGGNVLVPCYPSGVTYDLFECLSGHLDNSGLHTTMFFISPVADSSLAYSNIFAEWLSQGKQNKVYVPEEPFPHAFLVRNGRLKHYRNLYAEGFSNDFRQPCIVFCGHPSLRFGDSVHLVELWSSNPLNTIVFTEPDFPYLDALAPFQPLTMKAVYCPIDTSLSFTQANKLIRDLKPLTLLVPEQYTVPPAAAPHKTDLVIVSDPPPIPYKKTEVLSLPLRRRLEKIEMDPEFASLLLPSEVRPGIAMATVTGSLHVKDNKYILKALPEPERITAAKKRKSEEQLRKKPAQYTWGSLDIDDLIQKLTQDGITDAKVEESATGYIVHLPNEDSLIQVEDTSTHIICDGEDTLRCKLRDILLQCLSKF